MPDVVAAGANKRGARDTCGLGDDRENLRRLRPDHDRCAGLDNPGFFVGDRFERRPEIELVIVGNRRNGGDLGCYDVGRVEAAAESDLDDRDLNGRASK